MGRRVLLIDLDPQANATSGVGLEKIEGSSSYRVLLGEGSLLEKIQPTAFERLEIIPSEVDLCGVDIELARTDNHLHQVARCLKPVRDSQRFDVIFVDCPPYFGDRVFETMIPRSTRLAEAPSFGKPIIYYDKFSAGAAAYQLLAQEVLKRLETP